MDRRELLGGTHIQFERNNPINKFAFVLVVLLGVILVGAVATHHAEEQPSAAEASKMLKVVVHVNFADGEQQMGGLKNMANILKAVDTATIEVVCHGQGIALVVDGQSKHADVVAKLIAQGVRFMACENTLREKSIPREKLLSEVGTVPSGAVEVIRKQHEGYGYFKP